MSIRLDIAFMGRDANPILVKSARRIEHDAKWRGWKDRAVFAGVCVVVAVVFIVIVALWAFV
jgi:hypothetical protein